MLVKYKVYDSKTLTLITITKVALVDMSTRINYTTVINKSLEYCCNILSGNSKTYRFIENKDDILKYIVSTTFNTNRKYRFPFYKLNRLLSIVVFQKNINFGKKY